MVAQEPNWYQRGLYYGVKRDGAPQVMRADFQRAAVIVAQFDKVNKG